ncbi:acyl-CoA thioesterase [Pelagicoccus sp. NFK12]|uniref:Acyl-CoA thioesterase n=1 Tax=Pelagicoccus enzymogenes TaxID=2773457 RepID=A0A927F8K1_9BACT|nr:hotdog domain-containing protein [Pelagicoccus enzymogenes]MBD5779150.1 acyl-CoA thioesterase [Pelagicoccus enzymogenes]MDQ8201053.1 hotdog domain-containing protein [Pelagicoccus enzymogenes]
MDNYKLVHPGHLNHHGFLFGGNMLKWVDEYAYIAACADFPNQLFVTVAMDQLQFRKRVRSGEILRFRSLLADRGKSSVRYSVAVTREKASGEHEEIFATHISYVCVDETGEKKLLPRDVVPAVSRNESPVTG